MERRIYHRRYEEVFKVCENVSHKYNFSLDSQDKEKGLIHLSTPPTIRSWGEDIRIKIETIDENSTEINVSSSPKAQFFDWGKSKVNESRIIGYLDDELE